MANKLLFYDIAEGELATTVQKDFEEAQAIVHQRGLPAKIAVEITIYPESRENPGTNQVEFKSAVKPPPRKSIRYLAEVNKEGQMVETARQVPMDLTRKPEPKEGLVP